jgi:hypothetical protein
LWAASFAVFCLLYLLTCQRGLSWQDSGMFQWRVWAGDYHGDLGLALAHPLYIAAGQAFRLLPERFFAAGLNFFSGLGMAVALANLAALVALVTGRTWAGFLAAAMLSVAHTVWWLSTVAEVYTWSVAGLTGELWLLVLLLRRPRPTLLAALAFVNGLGWCVHNFALLPLPVYVVVAVVLVARRRLPVWSLAAAAAAYVAGSAMYLAMIVETAVPSGNLVEAVRSALFGGYGQQVVNVVKASRHWRANLALASLNFASALLPLAVVGWLHLRRAAGTGLAAALAAITCIELAFVLRYPVPDQFTFLLPTLTMVAVAAGIGLGALADVSRRARRLAAGACCLSILLQPLLLAAAPALVAGAGWQPRRTRRLPFRDELRYWLVPWKHNEDSAERFAAAALRQARAGGVILADETSKYPLALLQERDGLAPLVKVQMSANRPLPDYGRDPTGFRKVLGNRPLYLVTKAGGYVPEALTRDAKFERGEAEALYRLVGWNVP